MTKQAKILVANWKTNPKTAPAASRLAAVTDAENVIVAPPFVFLAAVGRVLKKSSLAAQDCYWADGAFTGAVSAAQLKNFGVKFVIVGHSERRQNFNETDAIVAQKVRAVLEAGMRPILCVGEPLFVRRRGLAIARNFIEKQLKRSLDGIKSGDRKERLIIAYEPVWAISPKGKIDKPADAAEMIRFIKNFLESKLGIKNSPVLYGGSVNARRAGDFLSFPEIDGLLVGAASRRPADFRKIIIMNHR